MAAQKVSIYDIAQIAGISAGSVSKILNGKGNFSEKTRSYVLEIARREGYVPNEAAQNLRTKNTKTVGIITPNVSNEFYGNIIVQAEEALRSEGYVSYIANHHNDRDIEAEIVSSFMRRRVDGLLLVGGHRGFDPAAAQLDVPVVCVDRGIEEGPRNVFVGNDVEAMVLDAVGALLGLGCERVAFLSVVPFVGGKADRRLAGYRKALAEAGIRLDKNLILEGRPVHPHDPAETILDAFLDEGYGTDGVVAVGDRVAVGALASLEKHGLVPGQDVAVIGMDNTIYSQIARPSISTIERHIDQMAACAVEQLLLMMEGKGPAQHEIIVGHEVVERETTMRR